MIKSKSDYLQYLEKDRISTNVKESRSFYSKIKSLLIPHEEYNFIKSLRKLEYCQNVLKQKSIFGKILWIFYKFKFRRLSIKYGYSIPINVIGPGLSLPHRGGIVINPNTTIGNNCRIHVGVNIGAHKNSTPKIGNNVYIGPGAIIFGDIEIADNITIGANATVNKSFTVPNVTIGGTPAKIIKTNTLSWNGK